EQLKDLGASYTISLSQNNEEIAKDLQSIMKNAAIDAVIDYLWGESISIILDVIKGSDYRKVRVVNVGNMGGDSIQLPTGVLRGSAIELHGSGLGSYSQEEFTYFNENLLPEVFEL